MSLPEHLQKKNLPTTLKAWRENANLTQEQLGERLGFARAGVGPYESGRYSPSLDLVARWAEACSTTLGIEPVIRRDPADLADAICQLDCIDEWLNARKVPEVGTTLERVVFALGRCWTAE